MRPYSFITGGCAIGTVPPAGPPLALLMGCALLVLGARRGRRRPDPGEPSATRPGWRR